MSIWPFSEGIYRILFKMSQKSKIIEAYFSLNKVQYFSRNLDKKSRCPNIIKNASRLCNATKSKTLLHSSFHQIISSKSQPLQICDEFSAASRREKLLREGSFLFNQIFEIKQQFSETKSSWCLFWQEQSSLHIQWNLTIADTIGCQQKSPQQRGFVVKRYILCKDQSTQH